MDKIQTRPRLRLDEPACLPVGLRLDKYHYFKLEHRLYIVRIQGFDVALREFVRPFLRYAYHN